MNGLSSRRRRTKLDGERRCRRTARKAESCEVLDGALVWFPNTLPVHHGGRCEQNNGYGRADGQVAGITDGTAMTIRVPMFVDCGDGLQTHKAGEQQRHQERPPQTARCEYTNHALLFDDCSAPSVAEGLGDDWQKMRRAVATDGPFCEASLDPAQGRITFSACRPFGPRLTSNSTSQPSSRLL